MTVSKKQQACVTRYVASHYDRINVTMPKGKREELKQYADSRGLSVNALIMTAIDDYMYRNRSVVVHVQKEQETPRSITVKISKESKEEKPHNGHAFQSSLMNKHK